MAEEPPDSARLRPNKAIRVNLTADGQNQSSVRQHTAGSGVHSEESMDQSTTPVNDAESEAYSEDSPTSVVSNQADVEELQGEVAPVERGGGPEVAEERLGTPSEVDEAVDQTEEQPPSIHSDSNSEIDRPADDADVASVEATEAAAEVASAGSEDVQPVEEEEEEIAPADGVAVETVVQEMHTPVADILVISIPEVANAAACGGESDSELQETPSPSSPSKLAPPSRRPSSQAEVDLSEAAPPSTRPSSSAEEPAPAKPAPVPQMSSEAEDSEGPTPRSLGIPGEPEKARQDEEVRSDPETEGDPDYDEDQFESSATQSAAKSLRTESRSLHVDSPDDADGGYTSAYHSDRSDSDASDEEEEPETAAEEALKTELAQKDEEQEKLAAQMHAMQREMEALRKLLEEQQVELTKSSQELQRARAELDELRQEQADSAKASKAEKDAFRQVEKLITERKSLKEQLQQLQEQMSKMESLQEKLQQRLRATELERDAIRQRLQAETQLKKPHRIDEAESARLRTGGEFRTLQKPAGKAAKPQRRREGAKQRRDMARGGTGGVWCFQPRSKAALAIRVLPSLDAPRTGQKILPGDAFKVSEQHKGPSRDMVFLKLADGRGWAFNRSPDVGTLCVPRPAGKDPLAPYRLPEGNRLPGKIRQDHVTTHLARPRLPMIPKPVRDNRVPWH